MPQKDGDKELRAIQALIAALEPLDAEARARVVNYVFGRLDVNPRVTTDLIGSSPLESRASSAAISGVSDIRTLRDTKVPNSANEMTALVGYYLSELAPVGVRKDLITVDDVKLYFKQAGFRLPNRPHMALVNAKNAGYLDSTSETGVYRLNPVGYNLVVHGLPAQKGGPKKRKRSGGAKKKKRR